MESPCWICVKITNIFGLWPYILARRTLSNMIALSRPSADVFTSRSSGGLVHSLPSRPTTKDQNFDFRGCLHLSRDDLVGEHADDQDVTADATCDNAEPSLVLRRSVSLLLTNMPLRVSTKLRHGLEDRPQGSEQRRRTARLEPDVHSRSRMPSSQMYFPNLVPSLCPTKYTRSTSVILEHPCATMRNATLIVASCSR